MMKASLFNRRSIAGATALVGIPALAAAVWLSGPAQADAVTGQAAPVAGTGAEPGAAPVTGVPVLIKAAADRHGQDRILTVTDNGSASLEEKDRPLHASEAAQGTLMELVKVGPKNAPQYQIISLSDDAEGQDTCLSTPEEGDGVWLAVCDAGDRTQHFTFRSVGPRFDIVTSTDVGAGPVHVVPQGRSIDLVSQGRDFRAPSSTFSVTPLPID